MVSVPYQFYLLLLPRLLRSALTLEQSFQGARHVFLPIRSDDKRAAYLLQLTLAEAETSSSTLLTHATSSSSSSSSCWKLRNEALLHCRDVLQHIYGRLYKRTNYENLRASEWKIEPRKLAKLFVLETSFLLKERREKAARAVRRELLAQCT